MFCAYCGAMLEDGSVFCSNCGEKVIEITKTNKILDFEDNNGEGIDYVEVMEDNKQPVEEQSIVGLELAVGRENPEDFTLEIPIDLFEEKSVVQTNELEFEAYTKIPIRQDYQVDEQVEFNLVQSSIEPEIDMRACKNCGALLEHNFIFCSNCGSRVASMGQETNRTCSNGTTYQSESQSALSGISESEQLSLVNNGSKKQHAKSKKRLIITVAVLTVLIVSLGGFLVFTKITLGNLEDSVAAFETLVSEKGLEDYEQYSTLMKEAKEKASGWNVFGASEIEDRIAKATKECETLSEKLTDLIAKRSDYENLDEALIMDSEQTNTIIHYLEEFDAAIALADTDIAQQILSNLEVTKDDLIANNQVYVASLMQDIYDYENPDFTKEDWDRYNDQIVIVENFINNKQFVQAKVEISNCTASRTTIEQRITTEKEAAIALLSAKPETLKVMISDVIYDETSYRNEFEQALETEVGIDVIFDQFKAESYYDAVSNVFASNTLPDVVYLSQDMYKEFQSKGYLADLTQYWQEAELLNASNYYGEEAMGRLKIDSKLYGFTPIRGNTCVTYIRQSWLDELGLSVPTTYEEFDQMLVAFTENKMGNNNEASYGMTAPGFLFDSEPYTSFLQPFYQKAVAEFYQTSSGEWVDGFAQEEMVQALYRLQEAYQLGILDQGMAQRTISEAIREFGSGKCGVISLWEGEGADYLIEELKNNGIGDDLIVMEPLTEMGCYVGREPNVFAITTACKNPGGVMKYFFEPMLDGLTVQKLWSYGVEGYHWSKKNQGTEDSLDIDSLNNQLETLPYEGRNEGTYNYNYIDPLRALANLEETDPGISQISDLAAISASIANQYYKPSPNVKYNATYWYSFGEVSAARKEAVSKVMLEGVDPVTAIDEYKNNVKHIIDKVLSEMNQL